ncbi:hypothetical protein [Saccharothrix sp. ALI-22-I]|uniref:hypothetical protein n=1 Tax=Saccharothrix sp. ALI-22-I TaxID=1933778 RepID=UPI00097C5D60|nr:hypothetical protein [Saccharothrix sp. ALI-22-I]
MNSYIEDLIQDAVRRQEELAGDPDRIRAALPERAARKVRVDRTWRLAAVGAAACVAAAVAVPTVVLRDSEGGSGPAASPTASSTASPAPRAGTFPLRFRPTWLPPGLPERSRSIPLTTGPDAKASTVQTWSTGPVSGPNLSLTAYRSLEDSEAPLPPNVVEAPGGSTSPRLRDVDINGKAGRYDGDSVVWRVDSETRLLLTASGLGLSEDDLLRVARSVRPDDTRLHVPLRVDRLPAGVAPQFATVDGESPTSWEASIFAERTWAAYVSVRVGTVDHGAAGEAVTIGGRAAHLAELDGDTSTQGGYRTDWRLTVDLGDGRRLTVYGGSGLESSAPALTREDMIGIGEQVEVDPNPDLGWLGG